MNLKCSKLILNLLTVCISWNKGVRRILNLPHDAHTWLQWRSEGGGRRGGQEGGICPRAPPGGGRQNPAKDLKKIYIKEKF